MKIKRLELYGLKSAKQGKISLPTVARNVGMLVIGLSLVLGISGCASTGYHASYTCPVCKAKIFQYKDSNQSVHKQDTNETDSKVEPFIKLEVPLNKIGG